MMNRGVGVTNLNPFARPTIPALSPVPPLPPPTSNAVIENLIEDQHRVIVKYFYLFSDIGKIKHRR